MDLGPGRSHMKPVKDSMAHAENMAKAMVIAPLAGVAAAVANVYKYFKNSNES